MTAAKKFELVSVEDYLADELTSDIKHEYLGGFVYAMAGERTVHDRVAGAWYLSVFQSLRRKPCEPFGSDMKIRVQL